MNRSCTFAASLAIMAAVSALAGVAAAQSATQTQPMDSALPRYRLSVGQELVYESNLVSQPDGGSMSYLAETRRSLWVTRRNADGSWRVVLFDSGRLSRKQGNRSLGDPRINKQLVQFTIRSDGRLAGRILQDPRVDLKAIFPALPAAPATHPAGPSSRPPAV